MHDALNPKPTLASTAITTW